MRGRKRKQGMLAQLPRKPQGTWPEWRPAVHIGQTPGLPGIGLGSVPGCEMATLHGAFFQEPDDKDPSQQARFGHAPAEGYVRPGRQGGDTEKGCRRRTETVRYGAKIRRRPLPQGRDGDAYLPRLPARTLAQHKDEQHPRTPEPGDTQKDTGCGLLPGRGICPDACVRQAKAYRHEGMGYQEIPEHEASLRDGKGERAETGTGKGRKYSLDLMLEQTIFAKNP